jgi:glycosyltransferase involved in cell wall biosynthesis
MVGRLSPEKNYDIALSAFAEFKKEFPNALLRIAGNGPCEFELKQLTKKLRLTNSVEFLGFTQDVTNLMRNSDVLLHVASTESYGRVYVEALICNLCIATQAIGVVVDLIDENPKDFVLIENLDPTQISTKLMDFFSSGAQKKHSEWPRFGKYVAHNQDRIFLQIADYLEEIEVK